MTFVILKRLSWRQFDPITLGKCYNARIGKQLQSGNIVDRLAAKSEEASESPLATRIRRVLPTLWIIMLLSAFFLNVANLNLNHPERLQGWRAVGIGLLLLALLSTYHWFSQGRIYHDHGISERYALLLVGLQLTTVLLLMRVYDTNFAWFGLTTLYQIIGGLPRRYWPLPFAGLLLIFVMSLLPRDGSFLLDTGMIVGSVLFVIGNVGIALFILSQEKQRDHLRLTLERLRRAYTALTINTAQAEELAILRERARLARTMHDEMGHALVIINVKLEAAQLLYAHDSVRGDAELEAARALIRRTMTSLRHALSDLRAPVPEYEDLVSGLGRLAHEFQTRTGMIVKCNIDPAPTLPPSDTRRALWYVTREALINVEKHAQATSVTITFEACPTYWLLRIVDDGCGMNPHDIDRPEHYGVIGMRERIYEVAGILTIERGTISGMVVEVRVPTTHIAENEAS